MIVAIMQPYFFPYVGYFQLMQAVDVFVFHDDAQYIKGGWVNRNRILVEGHADWLTMPVRKGSNYLPINRREFAHDEDVVGKIKRRIAAAYGKCPNYGNAAETVFETLSFPDPNIASFNCNSLRVVAGRIGISCEFAMSSDLLPPSALKGQDKVIELCRVVGAKRYVNPIGGVDLYDPAAFSAAGIELNFLRTQAPATPTGSGPQHLSVIDGLMNAGFEGYRQSLSQFAIFEKEDAQA